MKKEVFDKIKSELMYILIIFALAVLIVNFIFFNEGIIVKTRAVFSFFWLFIIPGYSLMLYFEKNLELIERLIIGIPLGAAVTGILSYYLGLAGLNLNYHIFLLPPLLISAGFIMLKKKYD